MEQRSGIARQMRIFDSDDYEYLLEKWMCYKITEERSFSWRLMWKYSSSSAWKKHANSPLTPLIKKCIHTDTYLFMADWSITSVLPFTVGMTDENWEASGTVQIQLEYQKTNQICGQKRGSDCKKLLPRMELHLFSLPTFSYSTLISNKITRK